MVSPITKILQVPFFNRIRGSALGPIVTGAFSDRYGIRAALKIASAIALISFVLFYLGSRYYARDLDKVERVALTAEE